MTTTADREGKPAPARALLDLNPYLVMGYLALAVIFLAQMEGGLLIGNIVVVAAGAFCLMTRIRRGPVLFLGFFATIHLGQHLWMYRLSFQMPRRLLDPADLALCIGVLAYVAAHYRLQSMMLNVLAPDPRRRTGPSRRGWFGSYRPAPVRHTTRNSPGDLQVQKEIGLLLVALPLWALLAQFGLTLLPERFDLLDMPGRLVQGLLFIWALGGGLLVAATFFNLWKRRRMSREAAQLLLQDALWRDTRREQRRVNRWLAWKKLRS